MALFRRLTSFSRSKKNGEEGKADRIANGTKTSNATQPSTAAKSNATNGYVPAVIKEEEPKEEEPKKEEPTKEEPKEDLHAATRADVASIFEQYAQLIHASLRPLPNQSGDGAYLEKVNPGLKELYDRPIY
jgi:linoleate 10R-lipoxygenase